MACACSTTAIPHLSNKLAAFRFTAKSFYAFPKAHTTSFPAHSSQYSSPKILTRHHVSLSSPSDVFTWDDVVRISQPEALPDDDPSDLNGYSDRIKICNRRLVSNNNAFSIFLSCQTDRLSHFLGKILAGIAIWVLFLRNWGPNRRLRSQKVSTSHFPWI